MCKDPDNAGAMIVSRIIGVPEDRITVSNARVTLNGREIERNSVGPSVVYEETASGERVPFEVSLSEERMGARNYTIAFMERGRDRREFRHDVESGFFLVSDNRNRTRDSRHFGEIPIENCIGMPFLIVWPGEDSGDFKKKNRILEWID
jgi:signal peptidase I